MARILDGLTNQQRFYRRHAERCRQKSREWYKNNREKVKAISDAYRAKPENRIKRRLTTKAWMARNKDRVRMKNLEYLAAHPGIGTEWHRIRKYGVYPDQWKHILESQHNRCAICSETFDPSSNSRKANLDHNHSTHEVRGALCGDCNRAIGLFREDHVRIMSAAKYLEAWR